MRNLFISTESYKKTSNYTRNSYLATMINIFSFFPLNIKPLVVSSVLVLLTLSCHENRPGSKDIVKDEFPQRKNLKSEIAGFREAIQPIELNMIKHGLVDILTLDSTIVVELKYSTNDNFLGRDVYQGMQRAYLQPDVAQMLVKAQQLLKEINPDYTLVVYDAARPRSIQQKMWDAVEAPFDEKIRFLSNPRNGSIHNFGAAVDVSILDEGGKALDMGTGFDHMGELAYPSREQEMLEQGRLTELQIANRRLLRRVMYGAGFWGIQSEWWHFNACTREEARKRYTIIE